MLKHIKSLDTSGENKAQEREVEVLRADTNHCLKSQIDEISNSGNEKLNDAAESIKKSDTNKPPVVREIIL